MYFFSCFDDFIAGVHLVGTHLRTPRMLILDVLFSFLVQISTR